MGNQALNKKSLILEYILPYNKNDMDDQFELKSKSSRYL